MAQKLNPFSGRQFLDANGDPYSGAQLFAYVAGSSTKTTLTKDSAGTSNHANPIILNSRGEPADAGGSSQAMWQAEGVSVKLVLAPSTDSDPPLSAISTWDNLSGVNDTAITIDQWVSGPTPTYVSATQFTLVGDQTSDFHVGRRVKTTNSGGTIYGTITASAYTSLTTVTVVNDSGSLDAGLSAVSYGLLSADNPSVPGDLNKIRNMTASGTVTHTGTSLFQGAVNYAAASGTDTYTATLSLTALTTGAEYKIYFANANTSTTPTLNLDSLGAKTIKLIDGSALVAGDINGQHTLRYNGTDMILMNPLPSAGNWTPTLQDTSFSDAEGQTYNTTYTKGTFTRLGTRMFISGEILMTGLGTLTGADAAVIAGLPRAASANHPEGTIAIGQTSGLSITAGIALAGEIQAGNSYINIFQWNNTGGAAGLFTVNNMTAAGHMTFTGQYNI